MRDGQGEYYVITGPYDPGSEFSCYESARAEAVRLEGFGFSPLIVGGGDYLIGDLDPVETYRQPIDYT